ncbi:hypothetical protein [Streptomyces orinoci]|uniref:Uncharacterized protein n=1 Tax=Streptomyces orinoci TaxID=67339 RepID=A0ABV3K2Z4_STRON|nr:hypothetical protein [Streptomyces orinoci]
MIRSEISGAVRGGHGSGRDARGPHGRPRRRSRPHPRGLEDGLTPIDLLIAHKIEHWDRAFRTHGLDDTVPAALLPALIAVQRMARAKDEDQVLGAIQAAWDSYYRRFDNPLDVGTAAEPEDPEESDHLTESASMETGLRSVPTAPPRTSS